MKQCYQQAPPGLDLEELQGKLIVLEGPDGSGRSTHNQLLQQWLEARGHAVMQVGLNRSQLVSPELEEAKQGNTLSPRTRSLFYATDLYDQLENTMVPALRAGYIVLADRYIFTLMARERVRGADTDWLDSLYGLAIVPDAVFHLKADPEVLAGRILRDKGSLDYWESGMDIGFSRDWYESFMEYQTRLAAEFERLGTQYQFETTNADRSVKAVQADLRDRVEQLLS